MASTVSIRIRVLSRSTDGQAESDILYMRVPTQQFILLGSVEAATELLDRKSGIYSDRIEPIMMQLYVVTISQYLTCLNRVF